MESQTFSYHLLIVIILLFIPRISSDLTADRSALLRLQSSVRGRTLLWDTTNSSTPCSWQGVTCDNITNRVIALRLPGDGLTGQLPLNSIGNLTELRALSLRRNSLSGPIPFDISSCTYLQDIHLESNNFSGQIPETLFSLRNLVRVNFGNNNFSGNLSSEFNNLTMLRTLFLENNQFTGQLPELDRVSDLRQFNVSFNVLITGSIPLRLSNFSSQSFLGTNLCGGPLFSCSLDDDNRLSNGAIAGIAVGSFIVLVLILVFLLISWRKYKKPNIPHRNPYSSCVVNQTEHNIWIQKPIVIAEKDKNKNGELDDGLVFFGDDVGLFSLKELLSSSAEVMGKGAVGSTYKAYLDNGIEVIVKRLKHVCVSEKEFRCRFEEMGLFVHENLENIRGCFYGRDEKLVLYEPISNGSLFALLHGNNKQPLSFEIRAKVALGAARGIEYLHSISSGTTHGNIKSSNIFLTSNYEARVSEFGLTQLVSSLSNMNGYRAPEVTDSRNVSQNSDVYSFGVLILELLTSKVPDDALKEGIELSNWVQSIDEEKWTNEVLDSELTHDDNVVQLLHLGISCTDHSPDKRPTMMEVVKRIEEIIC
ncbi:hypothetical protein RD792_011360 [Penstemon davidsonii]|uniref:Protein kinase domain-containing protein n=1 Tax=Penstemon davidsonii TaxID=160366 RepID=A0ABR0D4D3_9LAMI|nr:hypothetical protein RD792_011360 [Penstemon davidsonii]